MGIRSFTHCSDHSDQMRDCERFAHIAQDQWATVRKLLRSLMTNEWRWAIRLSREWANPSFFKQITHFSFAHKKRAICKKIWQKSYFLVCFCSFFVSLKKTIRSFPFFDERCEQIAQVAHQKWANCSFFLANRSFANYSLIFLQKKSNSLRKPMNEYPTLTILYIVKCICIYKQPQNTTSSCLFNSLLKYI